MHILASGIHGLLSTARTLVFFCVIHHLANSYVHSYPAKTGDNEDRVRIDRLRLIAKRLTHHHRPPLVDDQILTAETLAFIKSLTASIGTAHNTADKREESGDLYDIMNADRKQTRLEVLKRVYRQTSIGPLENFRQTYTELYNAMVPFLASWIQQLIPGANSILQNAVLIPTVLPPADPTLSNGDLANLMFKFKYVHEVLRALLNNGQEFVQAGYKSTFTAQAKIIGNKLNTSMFATYSLPFHDASSDVSIMSCGMSCINGGVKAGMNYNTLMKLYSLLTFLVNKVVQTPT